MHVSSITPPASARRAYRVAGVASAADLPEGFIFLVDASAPGLEVIRACPLAAGLSGITGTVSGKVFVDTDASYHSIDGCPCADGETEPLSDIYVHGR